MNLIATFLEVHVKPPDTVFEMVLSNRILVGSGDSPFFAEYCRIDILQYLL